MSDYESRDNEEIYSKVLRAGRRTYFFDVRATKAGDYYLTITESKKFTNDDGSFHYKKHKIYLYKEDFISYKSNRNSFIGYILKFREKTKYNLAKLDFNTDELSIINALLLGDKNEIPTEIKANYAKAGAIHILAISGLHIGVVLLILTKLLSPLNTIKNGKNIKGIILILLLWMFAIFTGFSASVIRATTMFSFIVIGQYFQKSKVTEHALITSMFFILLCKPLLIFDIGFQLSYLAVFGIVWIQPKLQALIPYKNYFIQKTGQLITVSISAQIAILPLSIFYFHQFPGLFIISNLIIIPFLGILLGLGFLIILLSYIKLVPNILIDFYASCIRIMNWIISWVANKEDFIFNKLYISFLGLITSYLIIIFCYQTLVYRKTKFFIFLLLSIIAMQLDISFDTYSKYQKKEFIVFDDYKKSLIGIRKGHILYTDTTKIKNNFNPILSYEIAERTLIQHDDISKNIYVFQNNTIIKLDSIGVYPTKNIENPIIILTNNPKINLERLLQHIQPKQIIADGTNYNSNIELWRQTSDKQKTPFHLTRQNGAYILK